MKQRLVVSLAVILAIALLVLPDGSALRTLALARRGATGVRPSFPFALTQGTWTWPEPIKPASSLAEARAPMLVVDRITGRLHLVWEEAGLVRYAYRDREAVSWQVEARSLQGDSPTIALDAAGTPHVAYVGLVNHQLQILHCAYGRAGWGAPSLVSAISGNSSQPAIALAAAGGMHLLWSRGPDASRVYQVYHAHSPDNGNAWDLIEPIGGACGYAPALAIAPDGRLWVAWQGDVDGVARIYAASSVNESWSAPITVTRGITTEARSPALACDAVGQAHLVWEQDAADGTSSIQYAYADPSGAWSAPQSLPALTSLAQEPCLSVGADGLIHAAWDAGNSLALCTRAADGTWGRAEEITSNPTGIREVTLAVDAQGLLYAVWSARNQNGVWELFSSRRLLPNTPTPSRTVTPAPSATATHAAEPTLPPGMTATISAEPTFPLSATITSIPALTPSYTPTCTPSATPTASPASTLIPKKPYDFMPFLVLPEGVPPFPGFEIYEPSRDDVQPRDDLPPRRRLLAVPWKWSPIEAVSTASTGHVAQAPALAVAPDNTAYAVWEEPYSSGHTQLYYSVRRQGVWLTPKGFVFGEAPRLAIAPDGTVYLVYCNVLFGNYDIYLTRWSGHNWEPAVNVSNTSGVSTQPAIAITQDGNPILAWTDTTEGHNRIYYAWLVSGTWNTGWVGPTTNGSTPDLVQGPNGRLWLAFQAPSGQHNEVYALYGDGISWASLAQDVSESPASDSIAPRLASCATLGAFLAWQEDVGISQVWYADVVKGVDWWSAPITLSQPAIDALQPAIAANSVGEVYVAWDEDAQLAYRCRTPSSGAWAEQAVITNAASNPGEVALVAGIDRRLHALWSSAPASDERAIFYRSGAYNWPYHLWLGITQSP